MLTIAYLGPEKTNTHYAALKKFGRRARYIHAPTVDDVFHRVEHGQADYGVVPVENSLEGAVTHTLDRFISFINTPVKIQGEIQQKIEHHLIVHARARPSDIKIIFSHTQALAQCRSWLERRFHRACLLETSSTAEAVHHILSKGPFLAYSPGDLRPREKAEPWERAAIGRKELARGRGKKLRVMLIPQEERENKTRFLILGLENPRRRKHNKTSLLFSVKDKPGALHDALVAFRRNRINMTRIESRPSKRKAWEYLFFVDIEGHASELRVMRALSTLKRSTSLLRILGSYPVAARSK